MLYRHSFRKKKLDYIPFLLKKPLKSSYNILKVERKKKEREEEKERKENSLQGWVWSGCCPSLWFYLASSFISLNTIKALWFPFCFSKAKFLPSALLFLLRWPLTWLNLSLHVISLVRLCLTTPSDPYSILNHSIIKK